ncbi:MAG: hypothetical protein A7315_09150 [Candidatus Altiarchaeales archaeon WOR_SM1_79]|nr:MAG: hypothetical protein A7315_09150 [Candidatus Altiarchaeales archaeon WOR_SM1_79]
MEILRKTKSLCPRCLEVIPAEIVDDSGIVKIRKNCPDRMSTGAIQNITNILLSLKRKAAK